jgi:hypothetical protein
VRGRVVVGREQLDAAQRVPEPPDGVEPRREDEADAARRERLAVEARRAMSARMPALSELPSSLRP